MPRRPRKPRSPILWSSPGVFLLASLGAVVGISDFTQFPYLMVHGGGWAFLIVYFMAAMALGVPLVAAEWLIGRYGRSDPPQAARGFAALGGGGRLWTLAGGIALVAGVILATYFSVIAAWLAGDLVRVAANDFASRDQAGAANEFAAFAADPERQLFWFTLFLLAVGTVSGRGFKDGVERWVTRVFYGAAFLLVVLVIYGAYIDRTTNAMDLLFSVDFTALDTHLLAIALGHALYGLGIGTGSLMAYAAYLPEEGPVIKPAFQLVMLNLVVGAFLGLAIYPISLAAGIEPGAGPTLIFEALPVAFNHVPWGAFMGVLFYAAVLMVVWLGVIALAEGPVQWVGRRLAWARGRAAATVFVAAWFLGLFGILSLHALAFSFRFLGVTHTLGGFDLLTVAGFDVLVPLGALLVAILVGWRVRREVFESQVRAISPCVFEAFQWFLRLVVPVLIAVILFNLNRMAA